VGPDEGDQILDIIDQHRGNFQKEEILLIFEITAEADGGALAMTTVVT
jgi:hypothetical protein